jgi:hypothetical protein
MAIERRIAELGTPEMSLLDEGKSTYDLKLRQGFDLSGFTAKVLELRRF